MGMDLIGMFDLIVDLPQGTVTLSESGLELQGTAVPSGCFRGAARLCSGQNLICKAFADHTKDMKVNATR